jgi:co-chaperonin GroES (HSP10)
MDHGKDDPANKIYDKIGMTDTGEIPGCELLGNRVLLGIYERPEKTKSGIYLSDATRKEDEYQGKAAIVLAKGPTAFQSDEYHDFKGQNLEIGDWVMLFVSHGLKCVVNGQLCRIIRDQDITMKIPAPDAVY